MKRFYDCLTESAKEIWEVLAPGCELEQSKPVEVEAKPEDVDFIMRQKPASKKELEGDDK